MCLIKQKNVIPKENILITASSDIEQICSDLHKKTMINFVGYKRTYSDGNFFCLGGLNQFHIHSCEKGFFTPYSHLQKIKDKYRGKESFCYFVQESNSVLQKEAKKFNIVNIFVIVREYQNYFESIFFGSNNNELVGFCFNYFDVIEQFRLFFLDKAANLINQSEKNKFLVQPAKKIEQGYKDIILSSEKSNLLTQLSSNDSLGVAPPQCRKPNYLMTFLLQFCLI